MTVFVRIWKQNEQEKGQIFYTDYDGKSDKYVIQGQVDFNSWQETLDNEKTVRAIIGYEGVIPCDWYKFKAPRNPRKNVTDMTQFHFSTSNYTYDEWLEKVTEMMN